MARKGMGKGTGKGYKNLVGVDSRIHSQSSMGIKQPQRINPLLLNRSSLDPRKSSFFIKEALKGTVNLKPNQQKHIEDLLLSLPQEERKAYLRIKKRLDNVTTYEETKAVLKKFKPELKKIGFMSASIPLAVLFPSLTIGILVSDIGAGGIGLLELSEDFKQYFRQYEKEYKKFEQKLPTLPKEDIRYLAGKSTIKKLK